MTQTPPPYSNISGLYVQVNKHVNTTLANYEGNGRPGQLVVDTANYQLYISNANGNLNIVTGGGGSYSNANVAAFLPTYTGNLGGLSTPVNTVWARNGLVSGNLSVGGQSGWLYMADNGSGADICIYAPVGINIGTRWRWPNSNGTAGQYLQTDGTGVTSWQPVSGGTSLVNGNSNVVVTANSDVKVSVAGVANILDIGTVALNYCGGCINIGAGWLGGPTCISMYNPSDAYNNFIGGQQGQTANIVFRLPKTNGSNAQYLSTDGTGNTRWYTLVNSNNEFHVSVSGSDTTGNGSVINPYATIGQAVTTADSSLHSVIVVHPGTYIENVAVTANSITITGTGQASDSVHLQGNLTFSGNASFNYVDGLLIGNLIHSASGSLYIYNSIIGSTAFPGAVTKSGTGYLEINNSDLQTGNLANGVLTSMSVTGNGTVNLDGAHIYNLTVANSTAQVLINNSLSAANTTLTAGGLTIADSFLYSFTNGGNALTATGGVLQLNGSGVYNPNLSLGRIAVGAAVVYGYQNMSFDKANSTLSGTSLSAIGDFQRLRSDAILTGNIINGNSNIVIAANSTVAISSNGTSNVFIVTNTNANITGGLNVTQGVVANSLVSNANVTVSGNLRVTVDSILTGNANIAGNLKASNGVVFSNLTQFTTSSSNANIVMFDINGNVSYNPALFYNNGDNELHVGNLVINDNNVGTEIKTIQPIADGGYIQFSAGGNTPFTVKPTGSIKLSYAATSPSTIPPNGLGDMYFNNDPGNGTQGFYLSTTSSANGWDKIITASNVGGIIQLPAQTAAPTAIAGGIYYNSTTKQFFMCANVSLGWQVVNLT